MYDHGFSVPRQRDTRGKRLGKSPSNFTRLPLTVCISALSYLFLLSASHLYAGSKMIVNCFQVFKNHVPRGTVLALHDVKMSVAGSFIQPFNDDRSKRTVAAFPLTDDLNLVAEIACCDTLSRVSLCATAATVAPRCVVDSTGNTIFEVEVLEDAYPGRTVAFPEFESIHGDAGNSVPLVKQEAVSPEPTTPKKQKIKLSSVTTAPTKQAPMKSVSFTPRHEQDVFSGLDSLDIPMLEDATFNPYPWQSTEQEPTSESLKRFVKGAIFVEARGFENVEICSAPFKDDDGVWHVGVKYPKKGAARFSEPISILLPKN